MASTTKLPECQTVRHHIKCKKHHVLALSDIGEADKKDSVLNMPMRTIVALFYNHAISPDGRIARLAKDTRMMCSGIAVRVRNFIPVNQRDKCHEMYGTYFSSVLIEVAKIKDEQNYGISFKEMLDKHIDQISKPNNMKELTDALDNFQTELKNLE